LNLATISKNVFTGLYIMIFVLH